MPAPYTNIADLHEEVLLFLTDLQATNKNLFFSLRKPLANANERLKQGLWFEGNDKALFVSFWNGEDRIAKSPNIAIRINREGEVHIYLNARDSEAKSKFFDFLTSKLGRFTRTKDFATGELQSTWRRSYRNMSWEGALVDFINNDKVRIDDYLSIFQAALGAQLDLTPITEDQYLARRLQIEEFRKNNNRQRLAQPVLVHQPIQLSRLILRNIGHFGELGLPLDKRVTCLIGFNGMGKSTVLRAIALGLIGTNYLSINSLVENKQWENWLKIERIDTNAKRIYSPKKGLISLGYQIGDVFHENEIEFEYDDIKGVLTNDMADRFASVTETGETVDLFIGFPQGGGINSPLPLKEDNSPTPIDLLPLIKDEAHQKMLRLKNWVAANYNNYNKDRQANKNLYNRIEEAFRLISLVVTDCKDELAIQFVDATDTNEAKDRHTDITIKTPDSPNGILLDLVSQGYQNLFYWIGEIVSRCYQVNDYYQANEALKHKAEESIYKMSGVILIDEIDTYLHPKWQRNILKVLVDKFEKMNFIVTTHSMTVMSSLANKEAYNIYLATKHEQEIFFHEIDPEKHNPYGADLNTVAEDFIGIESREPVVAEKLKQLESAVARAQIDNANQLVNELNLLINPEDGLLRKLKSRLDAKRIMLKQI